MAAAPDGLVAVAVSYVPGFERARAAVELWDGDRLVRSFAVPAGSFSRGLWFAGEGRAVAAIGWDGQELRLEPRRRTARDRCVRRVRDGMKRCGWVPANVPEYVAYHDEEWGVPIRDDRQLFELLTLEGAQAGLSWLTILRKREGYRRAFDEFDAAKVARYTPKRVERLLADPGSCATGSRSSRP